ncbi:MAG TPA: SPFH domain-containing protein [Gammaproteobacteria bacterium]|nr:SPFH domain-containing protein [Gammaproteobacteria bacterium]
MTYKTPARLLLVLLALALLSQSVYVVPEGTLGVTRRLQSLMQVGIAPGPHLKLPLVDEATDIDAGGIALDSDAVNGGRLRFQTSAGETIEGGYFALWRIVDVGKFCTSLGCDETLAAGRLNDLIVPGLRAAFAARSLASIQSGAAPVTTGLVDRLQTGAGEYGLKLEQVEITGFTLPTQDLESVYTRMRTAAAGQAAEVRSAGAAQAAQVRAQADAEHDRLLTAADAEARRLRAGGDAQAADIYAKAARQEPDFFSFYQGLEAYKRSLAGRTVLVLDADSPYLKYLKTRPQ